MATAIGHRPDAVDGGLMLVRRLDRYVFGEFSRLFFATMLGFPVLLIISDLATRLEDYLNRDIPWRDLALSYVYWLPDSAFMVVPAAVLFATVFTIGSLTRHAELTAAKASGISFLRMAAPIFVAALFATARRRTRDGGPTRKPAPRRTDSRGSCVERNEPAEFRVRQ
jgi:lipopolysaccharide export system permease protein